MSPRPAVASILRMRFPLCLMLLAVACGPSKVVPVGSGPDRGSGSAAPPGPDAGIPHADGGAASDAGPVSDAGPLGGAGRPTRVRLQTPARVRTILSTAERPPPSPPTPVPR